MAMFEYEVQITHDVNVGWTTVLRTLQPSAASAAYVGAQDELAATEQAKYTAPGRIQVQLKATGIPDVVATTPPLVPDVPATQHDVVYELSPKLGGPNIVSHLYTDFTIIEAEATMDCGRNIVGHILKLIQSGIIIVKPNEAPYTARVGRTSQKLPPSA